MIKQFSLIAFLCVSVILLVSCTNQKISIQKDIDDNPKLKRQDVKVEVSSINNGYMILKVKSGFSAQTLESIHRGTDLREIVLFRDKTVGVLLEIEEILKKRSDVKAIEWTADSQGGSELGEEPNPVGKSPQPNESASPFPLLFLAAIIAGVVYVLYRKKIIFFAPPEIEQMSQETKEHADKFREAAHKMAKDSSGKKEK